MNQNGYFKSVLGILVLGLLAAPFVMANLDRVNPGIAATVVDNNQTFFGTIIAQDLNHTLTCSEPDAGFNPDVNSSMTVSFSDRNGTFIYNDYCLDSNYLIEYTCGGNAMVNGQINSANAFAIKTSCHMLGKNCVVNKCV